MSHHKRRRPKHQRAGCLYCKPHKDEREAKDRTDKAEIAEQLEDIPDGGCECCDPTGILQALLWSGDESDELTEEEIAALAAYVEEK